MALFIPLLFTYNPGCCLIPVRVLLTTSLPVPLVFINSIAQLRLNDRRKSHSRLQQIACDDHQKR